MQKKLEKRRNYVYLESHRLFFPTLSIKLVKLVNIASPEILGKANCALHSRLQLACWVLWVTFLLLKFIEHASASYRNKKKAHQGLIYATKICSKQANLSRFISKNVLPKNQFLSKVRPCVVGWVYPKDCTSPWRIPAPSIYLLFDYLTLVNKSMKKCNEHSLFFYSTILSLFFEWWALHLHRF